MINIIVPPLIISLTIGPMVSKLHVERPITTLIVNITDPKQGDLVDDTVPILGTVGNAEFDHYELHFALSPNPTDTWFPIVLSGTIPVSNGVLGQWDTNGISNGRYIIRLRAFDYDGNLISKAIVNDISINSEQKSITQTADPTAVDTETPDFSPKTTPLPNPPATQHTGAGRRREGERIMMISFFNSVVYTYAHFISLRSFIMYSTQSAL